MATDLQAHRSAASSAGAFEEFLHARQFDHPAAVVTDPTLTTAEKRSLLSSWASDACAVSSQPPLRKAPFARRVVTVDEIMQALRRLDRVAPAQAFSC